MSHWVVVANQEEARFYQKDSHSNLLDLKFAMGNPMAIVPRRLLFRHDAGCGRRSLGSGNTVKYRDGKSKDPKEVFALRFAKRIANTLHAKWLNNRNDKFEIVAEPKFLGKIRAKMDKDLKPSIHRWVKKDLLNVPKAKLRKLLA